MELSAFIGLVAALAVASLWRRKPTHATAYAVVLCGLATMALIETKIDGVLAFAVWTLASYALLNFPRAAAVYLASSFCYILELQGHWLITIQIASNILGLVGLVAIWYGTPRREYSFDIGAIFGGNGFVGYDTVESHARSAKPEDKT